MCGSVQVLRLVAFIVLLVAFVACCLGFVSPFWIQYNPAEVTATTPAASSPISASFYPTQASVNQPPEARNDSGTEAADAAALVADKEGGNEADGVVRKAIVNATSAGSVTFDGLWVRCDGNWACRCFAQNDFELEKDFPGWHKAAQGLFTGGLLLLLITLLSGGCYLCCRCCKESVALATALGALSLISFLPIALSIIVYGGFAYSDGIKVTGDGNRFVWGFFVSIAGALIIPLAAFLYFVDGRRKVIVEHEDCETAKMV